MILGYYAYLKYEGGEKKDMNDLFMVRSLALMNDLIQKGHRCKKIEDSEINPRLKVFFFDNNEEVRRIAIDYQKERTKITNGNQKVFNRTN